MPTTTAPDGALEHDGMLWKPRRGATATFDEFIHARATFREITRDAVWNPWVREDRTTEYEAALAVMDQWRRAEPGHRMLTEKQIEARWARDERKRARARDEAIREREGRKRLYDEERAAARLALAEQRSLVVRDASELVGYQDGSRLPKMAFRRRQTRIDELEQALANRRAEIERLDQLVGDPETVIDENGWLPRERREFLLHHYQFDRERKVKKLRAEIAQRLAAEDRSEQAGISTLRRHLDKLLAVPPLTADDMCSDCPTPANQHGWTMPPFDGPCPAWPGWAARLRQAREMLATFASTAPKAPEPPTPKPQPLATIPSGLPIGEITQRLQELQLQYPDAEVRRGRANRWELWPSDRDAGQEGHR